MTITARGLLGVDELMQALALAIVMIRLHLSTRALRAAQRMAEADPEHREEYWR